MCHLRFKTSSRFTKAVPTTDAPISLKARMDFNRPIPRGKHLDERLRHFLKEAAVNHIRCPYRGGWIDISDLDAVVDHPGPLPHPAIDQPQQLPAGPTCSETSDR